MNLLTVEEIVAIKEKPHTYAGTIAMVLWESPPIENPRGENENS